MMKRLNLMLATALTAAAAPAWAVAAAVDTYSPEAVVEATAQCSRRADWPCLARLMDPVALKHMRGFLGEAIEMSPDDPSIAAMFGGKNLEQIKRLDDAEFFAAFLSGAVSNMAGAKVESVQVVGGVAEGEDQYHAVTRTSVRMGPAQTRLTTMGVVSVRRIDGQWRLQLKGDISAMTEAIRQARAKGGPTGAGPAGADGEPAPDPAESQPAR